MIRIGNVDGYLFRNSLKAILKEISEPGNSISEYSRRRIEAEIEAIEKVLSRSEQKE